MSIKELKVECQKWRDMWTWDTEELTYWLTHINSEIIVTKRNYAKVQGLLRQPHFELTHIEVDTTERIYNYVRAEALYEHKIATIPVSSIADFAFVLDKEVMKETYTGEPMLDENNEPKQLGEGRN